MIPDLWPHRGRQFVYYLAKERHVVAFGMWAGFTILYAVYLAYDFNAYGPPAFRYMLEVTALITQPLLIALLGFIALRMVSEQEHARTLAETIVANAPIGILTADKHGRITWINPTHVMVVGEKDPLGTIGSVLPELPTIRGTLLESEFRRALQGESFSLLDFEYTSALGRISYLSAHGVPLFDPGGRPDGLLVLFEDTSARRKWQEELQNRSAELMRRTHELEILREISIAITSTLDLDQILRVVYERVGPLLDVNTFFIALYDQAKRELQFELLVDNGELSAKFTQPLDPVAGLSGWIVEHRKPLLIGDLADEQLAPVAPGVIGSPTRSWLGVPLIVQDRLIGVMSAQSYEPNRFDGGHLKLLDAIANQISIVIENARLFGQTRARADELAAADEINRAINSTLELEQVLQLFFDQLSRLFNTEAGSIVLLDPVSNELVFEVVHGGAGSTLLHKRMRSHDGIVGWVTQHNQSLLVPDVRDDPRWFKGFDQDTRFQTRSIIAAPIRAENRTIGAVELINRRDGSAFSAADEKLLDMFAASAGIAIENAQLHRQTEKRLAEVTTLNVIANQLATSLDVSEILGTIVARLQSIFSSRSCTIHLLDSEGRILKRQAVSGPERDDGQGDVPLGQGIVGRVALEHQSIYIPHPAEAPEGVSLVPGAACMFTVPLLSRDRVLGTLSLDCESPRALSDDDQRLLTTVAAQIATAVENAQLYADLKVRATRLEQAYDDLKELDRLKTEFVQNVSHELRTPLTFIKGYSELMRSGTFGDLPSRAREGMEVVAEKTDALIRLVNDILSLQRAEPQQFRMTSVNIGMLARATVRAATYAAAQAKINLIEEIAPDLPEIEGDPERLGEVFENLIGNAIKFSPDGGDVCVRVYLVEGNIRVQVQDHGIGIPADHVDKVFNRFYQVDGSTTRRFGGTGLGLAIVKHTVEAHGGQVGVESEFGVGSTFFLSLPVRTPVAADPE